VRFGTDPEGAAIQPLAESPEFGQTLEESMDEVINAEKRNLDQWCFAEHYEPEVLLQVGLIMNQESGINVGHYSLELPKILCDLLNFKIVMFWVIFLVLTVSSLEAIFCGFSCFVRGKQMLSGN
jgi:hypothetical protein